MSFPTVYQKELSEIPLAELPDTSSSTNWYTLNEAVAKNLKNPRPIFIYTYVDWCVPCKIMDKTTFKNKVIANYLNTKFYPVKMNALSQDSIQAFGYVFKGNGQGSPHQLIVAFMQNNFKFPGTFIMDGNQMVNKLQEYLPAVNLEVIAKYFGDGVYKTKAFQDYVNGFKGELRRE